MESLEGALSILLSHAKPVTDAQELPLLDALNESRRRMSFLR